MAKPGPERDEITVILPPAPPELNPEAAHDLRPTSLISWIDTQLRPSRARQWPMPAFLVTLLNRQLSASDVGTSAQALEAQRSGYLVGETLGRGCLVGKLGRFREVDPGLGGSWAVVARAGLG